MVFNKPVKTKEAWLKIENKIRNQLGYYKHPMDLTDTDITWLKKNIKQFDAKVLKEIQADSIKPDKPKQ